MKVIPQTISEVLVLVPSVFGDKRGLLLKSFNQHQFDIAWKDSIFAIIWPGSGQPTVSEKDLRSDAFSDAEGFD